jgi:hypothetical protein
MKDPHYREDGTVREYKIEEIDGIKQVVTRTVLVPPNYVKITWYDYNGNEIGENHKGSVMTHMFKAEVPGIHYTLIRSIEYPKIGYDINGEYLVKVTYQVLED